MNLHFLKEFLGTCTCMMNVFGLIFRKKCQNSKMNSNSCTTVWKTSRNQVCTTNVCMYIYTKNIPCTCI